MAFLPFYAPSALPPKLIIVGGGYAGMAALISLYRYCPKAEIILIDPSSDHLKVTRLHERLRPSNTKLKVPFSALEQRFGFRHVKAAINYDSETLSQWQTDQYIAIGDELFPFDYLLLALGTNDNKNQSTDSDRAFDLDDLSNEEFPRITERLSNLQDNHDTITVIGGGPTGIQFLFEIAHWIKSNHRQIKLRLIDGSDNPLAQFKLDLTNYVRAGMVDLGIDFIPNTFFLNQKDQNLNLENKLSGEISQLPSAMTFCFVGKKSPTLLKTNAFGQIVLNRKTLSHIFAAGDCAQYHSPGSNSATAQSAVRKGKVCARNILRHSGKLKIMEPYVHQDLGYVISLGPDDAIGWLGLQANVVGGSPAVVLKELVEAQHEMLLAGIDTYLI